VPQAASFAAAKRAGSVVRLSKIDTIASSLGALAVRPAPHRGLTVSGLQVIPDVLRSPVRTDSLVVTDAEAVQGKGVYVSPRSVWCGAACIAFANEQRIIVEPACGAALAAVRGPRASDASLWTGSAGESGDSAGVAGRVLVIVCGGSAVSLDLLAAWQAKVGSKSML
jgi:L-serine/L-threonine ammonia-lyase